MVFSALLAPIRMLFHTRFVLLALSGLRVTWRSPSRGDAETTWRHAIRHHGLQTMIGVIWAGFVAWLDPAFLAWVMPVAGALIVSIPLSVYTSRVSPGRRARHAGLFLIPEEVHPPREIRATKRFEHAAPAPPTFADAAIDPYVNALLCAIANDRRRLPASTQSERERIAREAVERGPERLASEEKSRLLGDPLALSWVHSHLWLAPRGASLAFGEPRKAEGPLVRPFG